MEESTGITFKDLERIRVSRNDLERWYGELYFEDTIKGTFMRVNIGELKDGKGWCYKIHEVVGVKSVLHPYQFGNKKIDKELIMKYGKVTRLFKMMVVSNSKFTQKEFREWREEWEKCNEIIPTISDINSIESKIKKTRNYPYNQSEINKIIEQNINQLIEDGSSSMNVTYIKTQLEFQFKIAKRELNENPSSEAQELYDKLKLNLDKLNEIQKKKLEEKSSSNSTQNINDRARKLQIEEDRKRSEMIKNRSKQSAGFDAFSTLQCRPQILWNTNTSNDSSQSLINKNQLNTENFDEKVEPKEQVRQIRDEFRTDFDKVMDRKERMINSMKSIEISQSIIDYYLNDANKLQKTYKVPKLTELHPVLKIKLEEKYKNDLKNEKKRAFTLEEYCSKFLN